MYKSAAVVHYPSLLTHSFISLLKAARLFNEVYECRQPDELKVLIETGKTNHIFISLDVIEDELLLFIEQAMAVYNGLFFIITGSSENTTLVYQTKQAGAAAFISKNPGIIELKDCLQAIHTGNYYISPDEFNRLLKLHLNKKNIFTPKELEVLQQIKYGKSIAEISTVLKLSRHTVISHSRNMMKKMKVDTITSLIKKAMEGGWI